MCSDVMLLNQFNIVILCYLIICLNTIVGVTSRSTAAMSIQFGSLKIVIAQGDLTKEQTGAIVNSSNKALDLTTGMYVTTTCKANY